MGGGSRTTSLALGFLHQPAAWRLLALRAAGRAPPGSQALRGEDRLPRGRHHNGLGRLLLALSWVGEGYDWDATRVVAGFVVAAVLLAAFIPIELRAAEPVIPLSLFKGRVFTSSALLMFMVGIGMFGIILYTPLFVQGVLGKTATGSGTVLTLSSSR